MTSLGRRLGLLLLLVALAAGCAIVQPETGEPVYNINRVDDGM